MEDVNSIASFSTAQAQARIDSAIAIKVLKLANQQQQSVLALVDAAVQSIEESQPVHSTSGPVDLRA
jgi:hypothetical protein